MYFSVAVFVFTGCASAPPSGTPASGSSATTTQAAPPRPLEPLADQPIIVFPTQYLSFHDNIHLVSSVPNQPAYLAQLDDVIESVLTERGLSRNWTFAAEISRIARRNSTVVSDPRALSAQSLRGKLKVDERLEEPLGSQIRSVLALKDGRFVLIPVEVDFQQAVPGAAMGVLRLVLIDARLANVKWIGTVRTDPAAAFTPAIAAQLASRFADLVLPLPQR